MTRLRFLILSLLLCLPPAMFATAVVSVVSGSVPVGGTIDIPVSITGVSDLTAFQFDLSFSPAVLQFNSVSEGPFLATAGTTFFLPGADDGLGNILLTADTLIGAVSGAAGSGDLAIFHFTGLATGSSPLQLSNVLLLDQNGDEIPLDIAAAGSVRVGVTAVPEPGVALPLVFVLSGIWFFRRARRASE